MPDVNIPPVFVLSTGRCGSTMVSDILNRHPGVLSVSEFFSFLGLSIFARPRATGDWMWRLYSEPGKRMGIIARGESFKELLYPVDDPNARFNRLNLPPILAVTLPHLTDRYEELFDELEPVVRGQPKQPPTDHYRHLFAWLAKRFGGKVWVERGGGSLLFASRLLRHFPEARVVHIYRDGRETTLSMSRHPPFRAMLAMARKYRPWGVDLEKSISRTERRDRLTAWLGHLAWMFTSVDQLPFDEVTLPEFAAFWSSMIETGHRVFGHFPPGCLLNLRFEDMQTDPEGQIRRLIRFIAPQLEDDAWVREAAAIPRPTPSKFARLSSEEQRAITEACRPGLERLGYPV